MIKTRPRAIALALSGVLLPGLHKFYLRQRVWGMVYLLLYPTHIPQFASILEGLWYLWQGGDRFDQIFNPNVVRLRADPLMPLQTLEEVQLAAELGTTLDVNRATVQDWQRLPGLSQEQVRSLTTLTQSGVQFHCLEDLAAALSIPTREIQPFAPILRFYYYDQPFMHPDWPAPTPDLGTATTPKAINPNHASYEQLLRIPKVDAVLAQRIIDQRQVLPYRTLVSFQQRLSLSADLTSHLMYYLQF